MDSFLDGDVSPNVCSYIIHVTAATCVSPSSAGPHGSCPLHHLHLLNLSFMIGMSNR